MHHAGGHYQPPNQMIHITSPGVAMLHWDVDMTRLQDKERSAGYVELLVLPTEAGRHSTSHKLRLYPHFCATTNLYTGIVLGF